MSTCKISELQLQRLREQTNVARMLARSLENKFAQIAKVLRCMPEDTAVAEAVYSGGADWQSACDAVDRMLSAHGIEVGETDDANGPKFEQVINDRRSMIQKFFNKHQGGENGDGTAQV